MGLAVVLVGGGRVWPGFETTRRATSATTVPPVWRVPEELVGLAVVPVGGGGAWMGFETTRRATSATTVPPVWRVPEELVGLAVVPVGGGGAWMGYAQKGQTPLVWRVPEGPEGQGGPRDAAPNAVRTPSLAGGRALRHPEHPWGTRSSPEHPWGAHSSPAPRARTAAWPRGHAQQPGPAGTRETAGARSAAAPRAPHSRASVAHRLSWMLRPGTASISSRV